MLAVFLSACGLAHAADPWITPEGHHNLYVATACDRFSQFTTASADSLSMAAPVTRAGVKAVYRYGVSGDLDVTLDIPASVAFATGGAHGADYATTAGFEPLQAHLRRRLLPTQAPLSLSAHASLRTGVLHRATTDRLTNLGEGTTDLGAGLATGYMGVLAGRAFVTTSLGGSYWHRLPRSDTDS